MRVYILDDDVAICRTLTRMVARDGYSAECFHDPQSLLAALDEAAPATLLLDINLRSANGLALMSDIARIAPATPIVMISGTSAVDDAIAAFRGGAVQFLRKPFRREELSAALAEAARIGRDRAEQLSRRHEAAAIRLSKREHEVLDGMVEGLQTKLIAHQLGISIRTVDMHRANIFAKLSARNAAQAVSIARRLQLVDATAPWLGK